jgi:hypothetical protein
MLLKGNVSFKIKYHFKYIFCNYERLAEIMDL